MAKFSFWANGILAVAAFVFFLGYSANQTQGDGAGNGFITLGVLFVVMWFVLRLKKKGTGW